MLLLMVGRKEEKKMGSTTETRDCHVEAKLNNISPRNNDQCCFVDSATLACPLRRGDNEHVNNRNNNCDKNCPSNYHTSLCPSAPYVVNSSDVATSCGRSANTSRSTSRRSCPNDISCYGSFNDNYIRRNSNDNDSSKCRRQRHRRISSSTSASFLTRPCALYLFIVLVILDFSDLSGILITSANSRTNSYPYNVTTISRNGFLVNGAFNNKNGHGLGLTASEIPILSMDSVFFDETAIGNQLTGFSESAEEEGENISEGYEGDENDGNHVEISRTVEPQMLKRLESQFLKLFGMAKRPEKAQKKQIKIPKYLLDLYQKQTGTELPTSNLNLPGRHTRTANTVRTFYHLPGNPSEVSYPWEGRENHIKFNLNSIPEAEKVTGAELRIPFTITVSADDSVTVNSEPFRESNSDSGNDSVDGGQVDDHHFADHGNQQLRAVRILLHDIMKPATSPKSKKPKETHLLEPITYPIDSKTVVLSKRRNGTSSFWLTFDVFPAVARWMSNPKKNHGLVLEIVGVTNEGSIVPQETVVKKHNLRVKRDVDEKSTSGVGHNGKGSSEGSDGRHSNSITTDSSSSAKRSSSQSTQDSGESSFSLHETPTSSSVVSSSSPTEVGVANDGFINSNENKKTVDPSSSIVLFTYSDDGHNPTKTRDAKTLSRHYRSAQNNKNRRKNQRNKNRKRNLCQRHTMFVDFQDVGWNDWIVAPPGYAAYYCSGECPFPMAEHLNATNHAVIQALVHSMNAALVPPPCCVPTKYSSLSLLYTDSSDKIVLKNYNEMVVDSCGCS